MTFGGLASWRHADARIGDAITPSVSRARSVSGGSAKRPAATTWARFPSPWRLRLLYSRLRFGGIHPGKEPEGVSSPGANIGPWRCPGRRLEPSSSRKVGRLCVDTRVVGDGNYRAGLDSMSVGPDTWVQSFRSPEFPARPRCKSVRFNHPRRRDRSERPPIVAETRRTLKFEILPTSPWVTSVVSGGTRRRLAGSADRR
jgi:hypothetical protein